MKKIPLLIAFIIFISAIVAMSQSQLRTVVSVTGSVFNKVTKQPVEVKYKVLDQSGNIITRGRSNKEQNGYYFLTGLKPGNTYRIVFTDNKNYFEQEFDLEIPSTDKYAEFSKDFLVIPQKRGLAIPQAVPTFELRKSKLRGGADFFLDDMINVFKENPSVKFTIECYPDTPENKSFNKELTKGRCQSLKEYFVTKGISQNRIDIKSHKNIDPNNPPPKEKGSKGKRYRGPVYYVVKDF